jgi:hypothetical protein
VDSTREIQLDLPSCKRSPHSHPFAALRLIMQRDRPERLRRPASGCGFNASRKADSWDTTPEGVLPVPVQMQAINMTRKHMLVFKLSPRKAKHPHFSTILVEINCFPSERGTADSAFPESPIAFLLLQPTGLHVQRSRLNPRVLTGSGSPNSICLPLCRLCFRGADLLVYMHLHPLVALPYFHRLHRLPSARSLPSP